MLNLQVRHFFSGIKNEFKITLVNEPSVFCVSEGLLQILFVFCVLFNFSLFVLFIWDILMAICLGKADHFTFSLSCFALCIPLLVFFPTWNLSQNVESNSTCS